MISVFTDTTHVAIPPGIRRVVTQEAFLEQQLLQQQMLQQQVQQQQKQLAAMQRQLAQQRR